MNRRLLVFALIGGLFGVGVGRTLNYFAKSNLLSESAAIVNLPSAPAFLVKVLVDTPKFTDISTGSLIRNDQVLTNWHALRNAKGNKVLVQTADGVMVEAKILKSDKEPDLALLEIPATILPNLCFAPSEPAKNDTILVTGYGPGGRDLWAGKGEVVGRRSASQKGTDILFVANFATVGGMSGSPALNKEGKLAGVLFGCRDGFSQYAGIDAIRAFLEGTEYWNAK